MQRPWGQRQGRYEPGVCAPSAKAQGEGPRQALSGGEEPSPQVHAYPGRALHKGTARMQGGGSKLRQPREMTFEADGARCAGQQPPAPGSIQRAGNLNRGWREQ